MVPENIMTKDPDSESGFSINQDVLNQLLKRVSSSSIMKRTYMPDDEAQYRGCENENEEPQGNHEEYGEENSRYHQAQNSNYHQQSTQQTLRNKYSTISPQQNVQLEEKRTQEHRPIYDYVKETSSTPYLPQAPRSVYQRQDEPSKSYKTAGVEQRTISDQYPFTEFSQMSFDQFKQIKAPRTNQYSVQDSARSMQQRYEQQQSTTRPSSQISNMQASAFSGHQPTPNVHTVQQEPGRGEEPTADYCQYSQHSFRTAEPSHQPLQTPSQPSPGLRLGNVSVRRASYPLNN